MMRTGSRAAWRLLAVAVVLLSAAPCARAELSSKAWRETLRRLNASYKQRDEQAFLSALAEVGRDNSPRAVAAIFHALELATELDVYEHAVALLSRMTADAARTLLLSRARGAADWREQYAALEAVAGWRAGRPAILAALSSTKAPLRRLAYRLVGENRLYRGVEQMIGLLIAADRTRDKAEQADLRSALGQLTGQSHRTGVEYRAWWNGLDFVSKDTLLASGDDEPERKATGSGSVSPLMAHFRRRRKTDWRYLTTREKGDILVVPGVYDKVQNVLQHLGIAHTIVPRADFAKQTLDPRQILIFNCERTGRGPMMNVPAGFKPPPGWAGGGMPLKWVGLTRADLRKIRRFVEEGGYLFTSDWELQNVLVGAFGDHVSVVPRPTAEHHYAIAVDKRNADHPLLRGVFGENPYRIKTLKWKIDSGSFLIGIKSHRVQVLVRSGPLRTQYGNGLVAVTFRPPGRRTSDGGRVLHVLSHFMKQYSGADDSYALQKMLLNFISLKQHWRPVRREKKK